jgi:hypothetical protein
MPPFFYATLCQLTAPHQPHLLYLPAAIGLQRQTAPYLIREPRLSMPSHLYDFGA